MDSKSIWKWILEIGTLLGAVACILTWLGIKPKDLAMSQSIAIPNVLWLLFAFVLFAIGIGSSIWSGVVQHREINRLRNTSPLPGLTQRNPRPSRLKIIEARWGIEGVNNPDVTPYLVERQVADSFAEPISADLFRGFDPVGGNPNKKLTVRYSFDGREATVIRPEFAWLILPEDEFLKKQVEAGRSFLGPVQFQLLDLAKRMQKMMTELPAPKPLDHAATSQETTTWMVRQSEWDQRIRYRYESEFADQINRLESSIGKDNLPLARCLTQFNANSGRVMHPKDIEELIHTLWDMARMVDGGSYL